MTKKLYQGPSARIRARDRTTPTRYSLHLEIMTDWRPVLGSHGYDVYSLYVALAALRVSLGARRLAAHLGMGRTPFNRYTQFLWLAGLIDIHAGDHTTPNQIDIVDPPNVTPMLLQELMLLVQDDPMLGSDRVAYWRESLFKRIDNWKSLNDVLPAYPTQVSNGVSLVTATGEPQLPDEVVDEIEDEADPDLLSRLMAWQETFTQHKAEELITTYPAEQIRRCMLWIEKNRKQVKHSATGLLLTMLKNGQWPEVDEGPDLSNQIPEQFRHLVQR